MKFFYSRLDLFTSKPSAELLENPTQPPQFCSLFAFTSLALMHLSFPNTKYVLIETCVSIHLLAHPTCIVIYIILVVGLIAH